MEKSSVTSASWLPSLLKFWVIFTLITLGVMLLHQSDDASFLGRYSPLVIVQIAALFFGAIVLWGCQNYLKNHPDLAARIVNRLQNWRMRRGFTVGVILLTGCILAGLWIFFLGNHLPTYGFLRMYLASSLCVAALVVLYGGTPPQTIRRQILPYLLVAGMGVVILAAVSYYPALSKTDEAFTFSMARNTLETGHFRPLIYRQAYPEYYYGGIWNQMMAVWLGITNISLTSGRLYVLLLSAISIGFLYMGTAKLYDRLTASFVVPIGIYAFAALNHVRFDIHSAFWLSIGIFFYAHAQASKRGWAHLGAGFAVALTIDSNPVAYCFGLGLFLVYVREYIQHLRHKQVKLYRPFFWMAAGGALALFIYLRMHSSGSFVNNQTTGGMLGTYLNIVRDNILSGNYIRQLGQYLNIFLTNQPILFGLMLLGIITAFRDRKPADYFFLILYCVWMLVIIFAYFYFPVFYLVLGLPIFIILAARGVAGGLPRLIGSQSGKLANAALILLTIWLFAALIYDIQQLPSQSLEDVVETGRRMSEIVPQEATIVAAEPYYFGMLNHVNFVGGAIESAMVSYFGTAPEAVWESVKPNAVVFSEGWPTEPGRSTALLAYMAEENFGLQACYETASFGRIELWAKDAADSVLSCIVVCNPRTGC